MRIGVLVADFPVLSETFVANDVRGLEALGHEVTVFALGGADPDAQASPAYAVRGPIVRVRGLRPPLWRKVQKLAARRRLIRAHGEALRRLLHERPAGLPDALWTDRLTWEAAIEQIDRQRLDALHVHFAMRQLLLGYHASRLLGLSLSVTLHAHDIFVNPLQPLLAHLLAQCAFVVTVSHYNREHILRLAPGLDPARVHVLAAGIDVGCYAPRYHAPHRPFRFAATGRLVEMKGFQVLLEAAAILAGRRQDFAVHIVGDGPLRAMLEARRTQLEVGREFQLLGRRDSRFLREWLPEQDAFVLPCVIARDGSRDGMPVALREAMACGLPTISSQLLGLAETVSPGTGWLVPAEDPEMLAGAMQRLIELPAPLHRSMAEAARAKAEVEFSLEQEVRTLAGWMQQAVQRTAAASAPSCPAAPGVSAPGSMVT